MHQRVYTEITILSSSDNKAVAAAFERLGILEVLSTRVSDTREATFGNGTAQHRSSPMRLRLLATRLAG